MTSFSQYSQFKEQSENQSLANSPEEILHRFELKDMNTLDIGYLNFNPLRNKFNASKCFVKNSLDISMISVTKLDETFPEGKFLMDVFTPGA